MIFDDLTPPERAEPIREPARNRADYTPANVASDRSSARRKKRRRSQSHERATRIEKVAPKYRDRGSIAWLWVLGLLIAAALGFAWYLHKERSAPYELPGNAPTTLLLPYIDPILAPLETGASGYSAETLTELSAAFRSQREKVNLDDKEVFSTAITISDILKEALDDRGRHMERLLRLGSPVEGASISPSEVRSDISETERKHLELAVGISWQRNSVAYRNRIEELWARLLRMEYGRFRTYQTAPAK